MNIWVVGVCACLALAALLIVGAQLRRSDDLPRLRAHERYFFFELEPRFRASDCIIRFNIEVLADIYPGILTNAYYAAHEYLATNDPVAALFGYRFQDGAANTTDMYMIFFDDCDRRREIGESLLAAWADSHPNLAFRLDTGPHKAGRDTVEGGSQWIDSPEYNLHHWELRKRAHCGETAALLIAAQLSEGGALGRASPEAAFKYYYLASQRLQDELDLVSARQRLKAILEQTDPDRHEALRATARDWDAATRVYGEGKGKCNAVGLRE